MIHRTVIDMDYSITFLLYRLDIYFKSYFLIFILIFIVIVWYLCAIS